MYVSVDVVFPILMVWFARLVPMVIPVADVVTLFAVKLAASNVSVMDVFLVNAIEVIFPWIPNPLEPRIIVHTDY